MAQDTAWAIKQFLFIHLSITRTPPEQRDTAMELALLHLGFGYGLQYRPPSSPHALANRAISIIALPQGETGHFPFLLTNMLLSTLPEPELSPAKETKLW